MNIRKKKKDSCFNNKYSCFIFHPSGNPPLGFPSRSNSFAFCALHKPAQCSRSPGFTRPEIRLLDYWRSQGLVFRFEFLF